MTNIYDHYINLQQSHTSVIELYKERMGEETGTNIYLMPNMCQEFCKAKITCIKNDNFVAESIIPMFRNEKFCIQID